MTRRRQHEDRPPDIQVGAKVRARRVRFLRKPDTNVEFDGRTRVRSEDRIEDVELETHSGSERRNLPDEIEPGVTYRDVEIGWTAEAKARIPEDEDADER